MTGATSVVVGAGAGVEDVAGGGGGGGGTEVVLGGGGATKVVDEALEWL